ncbi:hypothetical protein C347_03832 [Cryptococcus neoformans AD2-60a]|nr:hypothetical protein C347_03832 [Cryptococcus neoformans var. grubii AD2-60a]
MHFGIFPCAWDLLLSSQLLRSYSTKTRIRTTTAQITTRRPPHPLLLVQVEAGKPAPNRSLAGKETAMTTISDILLRHQKKTR